MSAGLAIDPPNHGRPYALITGDGGSLDSVPPETLEMAFRAHGALLIRGFRADLDAFRRLSDTLCSTWVINEAGKRLMIDEAANIQSVNTGLVPFPLHSEISRSPWRPDACLFYCIDPPERAGETTLCDGVAIAAALPGDLRAELLTRRLRFAHAADLVDLEKWLGVRVPTPALLQSPPPDCPFAFALRDGHVVMSFSRPFLHKPMFVDAPAFANFLLFARDLRNSRFPTLEDGSIVPDAWVDTIRTIGESLTATVKWQAGDLLVLDNSRFMHGRRKVVPRAQRLIASRFGYVRFAPVDPEEPLDPVWRRADFVPPPSRSMVQRPLTPPPSLPDRARALFRHR